MAIRDEVKEQGIKAQGQRELLAHLDGRSLSSAGAIKAFCYECMGFYQGGVEDCATAHCPLYPYNPYNPKRRKLSRPGQKPPKRPPVAK